MQIAEPAASSAVAPFGGQNYQIEGVGLLDFQPALAAGAGSVRGARGFCHDALVAMVVRLAQEFDGTAWVRGERVGHQCLGRRELREGGEAARLRLVEQGLAIQVQQVKPKRRERQLGAHAFEIELAAEPARGDLKGLRAAVGCEAEDFAVQDQLTAGQGADGFDDFRCRRGNVMEAAGENPDLIPGAMDLHAGAIELVFQGGFTEIAERGGHVLRGLGEHGLDGLKELDAVASQSGGAGFEGGAGHAGYVSGHHDGAAE